MRSPNTLVCPKELVIPGAKATYCQEIQKVLQDYPAVQEVTLYGSRARGTERTYSNIDLAVTKWGPGSLAGLQSDLVELNIPYLIDLVVYSEVDPGMQKNIKRDGKIAYTRTS